MTTADSTTQNPQGLASHELLTFKEAQDFLRVSRSTLYRLMWSGQLIGHKVGSHWRFLPADLQACVLLAPLTQVGDDQGEESQRGNPGERGFFVGRLMCVVQTHASAGFESKEDER
jgi:excisionase family DNA binding protein